MCNSEELWDENHLQFLTKSLTQMSQIHDFDSVCSLTTRCMRELTGAPIAGLALCKDESLLGSIRSVSAAEQIIERVETMMGIPLRGAPIAIPWQLRHSDSLNQVSWGKDIDPRHSPLGLGSQFRLDTVYGFPFRLDGKLYAVAGVVVQEDQQLPPAIQKTLDLFLRQASVALAARFAMQRSPLEVAAQHPPIQVGQQAAVILFEDGIVVDCKGSVAEVTGFDPKTLMGKPVHAWLEPAEQERWGERVSNRFAAAMDGTVQDFMFEHQRADGTRRVMETRLIPLKLPAGKTMLQAILRDVTERVLMEEALRESEAKYRDLFETSRDGIVMTDGKGCYIDCNPAFLAMLGYDTVDELYGRSYLEITPPEYHQLDMEQERLLQTSRYREFEKEYFRKNGDRILVWLRIWSRFDAAGQRTGGWSLIRDITSMRRMEEELISIEKFKLLGELAAAISHEIRNPLTTVRGFLQFLPTKSKYPPEDRELFELMLQELDSATTIIRDFLDMARPAIPRTEPLPLGDLLSSLARVMESRAIIENVQLITSLEAGLCIIGDPTQLRQVFLNLIQNALQAMPKGGVLTITASAELDKAVVHVTDTGVGIPKANLDRIGRPFFSTKPGGTGLGLPTCYRIIEAHGGKITVDSQEGVGTTFTVRLPLQS